MPNAVMPQFWLHDPGQTNHACGRSDWSKDDHVTEAGLIGVLLRMKVGKTCTLSLWVINLERWLAHSCQWLCPLIQKESTRAEGDNEANVERKSGKRGGQTESSGVPVLVLIVPTHNCFFLPPLKLLWIECLLLERSSFLGPASKFLPLGSLSRPCHYRLVLLHNYCLLFRRYS